MRISPTSDRVRAEEARSALAQLREAGIVVALDSPYTESATDERVRGTLAYFWAEHLDALAIQRHWETMTVTVIGAGGGGSWVTTVSMPRI